MTRVGSKALLPPAQNSSKETRNMSSLVLSPARAAAVLIGLLCLAMFPAASANAAPGIANFDGEVLNEDGTAAQQAGSHPFSASTIIDFNASIDPTFGVPVTDGNVKNIRVDLPAGFTGIPTSISECAEVEIEETGGCPIETQVGVASVTSPSTTSLVPLFNMVPPPGKPAQLAFAVTGVIVHLDPFVRTGGDYGLSVDVRNISQGLATAASAVTLWGVPADKSHDTERGQCLYSINDPTDICPTSAPVRPFLVNPTHCAGPQATTIEANFWQEPAVWHKDGFLSHLPAPDQETPAAVTGCGQVPFAPAAVVEPTTSTVSAPTGLRVKLSLPQGGTLAPRALATAHLKRAKVVLPRGITVSPAAAAGLDGCAPAQIALSSSGPAGCPPGSELGSVEILTPLLDHPVSGSVYLATQGTNPFNSLLALYIAVSDPRSGVVVKLAGKVTPDSQTGQLTAVFDQNPQLPFEQLDLRLEGGNRAPLTTPTTCGTYTTHAELTSWARPNEVVSSDSSFTIDQGCGKESQFTPGFEAGSVNPTAGAYSPFTLRVTRPDGQQNLSRIDATLPEGVLAKLAGVSLCPDSAAPSGNCPQASQVGTAAVGVGAGSSPLYVPQPGKAPTAAYLAGPYRGAPYSLVVKVPAQAGPFDLGTVAVRSAISVDPISAQVSVTSDPLPQILQGIPIAYRDVRVDVSRASFMRNPTSCNPMSVRGVLASFQGNSAEVSDRFQVGSCASLGFAPKLSLNLNGGTKRGTYPKLRAELKAPPGQANIGRVSVALPHSAFLAQNHIRTVCTRVQFAAKACPPGSVYGYARAFTPLLDKPLEGPVYLRSSSNKLPDLVASLDGQIQIDLAGRIDSVNGGIRTTFEQVPDAPVSKFVLNMKGGKKSLLVNSRDLCAGVNRATVKMDGQNGKVNDFRPVVTNSCGKKAKGKRKKQAR